MTEAFIRQLHRIVIVRGAGRRGRAGAYRTTECPVVDTVTRAIDYAPPEPRDVPVLMEDLAAWARSGEATEVPVPIRAGIIAHRFLSIHPFDDGNGRTARLLATAELWRSSTMVAMTRTTRPGSNTSWHPGPGSPRTPRGPEAVRVGRHRLQPRWARLVEQAKRGAADSTSSQDG